MNTDKLKILKKRLLILKKAKNQRKALLNLANRSSDEYANMSNMGWFLTIGSGAFGILTGISGGIESKKWSTIAGKLEKEILLIEAGEKILENRIIMMLENA